MLGMCHNEIFTWSESLRMNYLNHKSNDSGPLKLVLHMKQVRSLANEHEQQDGRTLVLDEQSLVCASSAYWLRLCLVARSTNRWNHKSAILTANYSFTKGILSSLSIAQSSIISKAILSIARFSELQDRSDLWIRDIIWWLSINYN